MHASSSSIPLSEAPTALRGHGANDDSGNSSGSSDNTSNATSYVGNDDGAASTNNDQHVSEHSNSVQGVSNNDGATSSSNDPHVFEYSNSVQGESIDNEIGAKTVLSNETSTDTVETSADIVFCNEQAQAVTPTSGSIEIHLNGRHLGDMHDLPPNDLTTVDANSGHSHGT
ncbi:hypothetical protein M0R45_015575 [Rubus argutus]|uniref:Uncharacterized protein n=1 Tax=Rubus argutus TaxID=59490 RepID=A0AAW1XQM4_RUBAR